MSNADERKKLGEELTAVEETIASKKQAIKCMSSYCTGLKQTTEDEIAELQLKAQNIRAKIAELR